MNETEPQRRRTLSGVICVMEIRWAAVMSPGVSPAHRSRAARRFMVSSARDGGTATGRSRTCTGDAHQACGHVRFASPAVPGRRAESSVMLCGCSCHRACPLSGRKEAVPVTVWQRRCACPGLEHERTSQGDPGDFLPGWEEYRETYEFESRRRSQARKDAFNAARSASSGKTRDEIQDLYIAELRARGLEIPSEPFLAAAVDLLSGDARAWPGKLWKWVQRDLLRS